MRSLIIIALLALMTASLASALPEVASQSTVTVAEGAGSVTQVSTNDATVEGDGAVYGGDIVQVGSSDGPIGQIATNTADVTGDDASSAQGISQAGVGDIVDQISDNSLRVDGDDAVTGQSLTQSASATGHIIQVGSNGVIITGDGALIGQVAYTAGSGSAVTQIGTNFAGVEGNNPTLSQLIASGALASGSIEQFRGNVLFINSGSVGGSTSQLIDAVAIGDTVIQVINNLVDEVDLPDQ